MTDTDTANPTTLDEYAQELRAQALDSDRFLVVAVCDIAVTGKVSEQCLRSLNVVEGGMLISRLSPLGQHAQSEARKILEDARRACAS